MVRKSPHNKTALPKACRFFFGFGNCFRRQINPHKPGTKRRDPDSQTACSDADLQHAFGFVQRHFLNKRRTVPFIHIIPQRLGIIHGIVIFLRQKVVMSCNSAHGFMPLCLFCVKPHGNTDICRANVLVWVGLFLHSHENPRRASQHMAGRSALRCVTRLRKRFARTRI